MADEIVTKADLPDDVQSEGLVTVWLNGANASARRVAPCLFDEPTSDQLDEAKLVLVGVIIRWSQAGAGGVSTAQQMAGPLSEMIVHDTKVKTGYNLWPSEIKRLQEICADGAKQPRAFAVDMLPSGPRHGHWVSTTDWEPW